MIRKTAELSPQYDWPNHLALPVIRKLGSGGMGVVYEAKDNILHRTVALKFLASHLVESEEHKQRFLREAKAAASLDHPNICMVYMVYEVVEADGQVFLAMSYVDGPDVRTKIQERPLKLCRRTWTSASPNSPN